MEETDDTRRKVVEKQAEVVSLGGTFGSTRRPEVQSEIVALLSKQSLAEKTSFLKDLCGGDGGLAEILHSTFTPEPIQYLHLGVPGLLKLCLAHYSSSDET